MQVNHIPDFYGVKYNLAEVKQMFESLMPNFQCVDISESIRLMLADFFYADEVETASPVLDMFERRMALLPAATPPVEDHVEMMEVFGDIFWTMADVITTDVLTVRDGNGGAGVCRPYEAYYTYDANSLDIMVYIPANQPYHIPNVARLDGRSVLSATRRWWPKQLVAKLPLPKTSNNGAY